MFTKGCVQMINLPDRGDARGRMVVIEGNADIPFEIKRIFYIFGSKDNVIRGQHANRRTEFVLLNVAGSCKVKVIDGKGYEEIFHLNRPDQGLYIPKMVWKDMYDFSPDSVLLVLASEHYDANEYIRNYEEYEAEMKNC